MENTTYRDERVISLIEKYYIPIRVNSEIRPKLNLRYNQGGLPSTLILDWNGNIVWGGIYVSPEDMIKTLEKFRNISEKELKKYIKSIKVKKKFKERILIKNLKQKNLDKGYIDKIYRYIKFKFDYTNGGFKGSPKYPRTDLAYFLIYYYFFEGKGKKLLIKTLEGYGKLIDRYEGGIYRYGSKENWNEPHYEKLLKDQAELSVLFFNAYSVLKNKEYLDWANNILNFSKEKLLNRQDEFFYNSQGADIVDNEGNLVVSGEDYFIHSLEKRREIEKRVGLSPKIEKRFLYTSNSLIANSLIYSYIFNRKKEDLNLAKRIVDKIYLEGLTNKGVVYGKNLKGYYLKTQIYYLEAVLNLYEITGNSKYLEISEKLISILDKYYYDDKLKIYTDFGNIYIPLNKISFVNDYINLNVRLAYILEKLFLYTYKSKYKIKFIQLISVLPTKSNINTALGSFYYFYPLINIKVFHYRNKEEILQSKKIFPKWVIIQLINSEKLKLKLGYENINKKIILICNMNLCFNSLQSTKKINKMIESILKR